MHPGAYNLVRRRLDLRGQVQGVGLRPFVYRLAAKLRLAGHVTNNSRGAVIEVEGPPSSVSAFEQQLVTQLPPLARIADVARRELTPRGETRFRIQRSRSDATTKPAVTPDSAVCQDCLAELFDPADRRYRYAFINCTNCGPRYSIIRSVPYDRPATTMAEFVMCRACQAEYDDPPNRRFHAQPNACPVCGPRLELRRADGPRIARGPIRAAAGMLREGRIVAVKGIGGYHLACRADREAAVARLRSRKLRDGKPLALMVGDLEAAKRLCDLTETDAAVLASAEAPIVLAPRRAGHRIAPSVAPYCSSFGVMLPYTPLHHLLFAEGLGPLVMTSANLAGQPLTFRDEDALRLLGDVADAFLAHDRDIFRPLDDSVVFAFRGTAVPIRRARGFAPQPLRFRHTDWLRDINVLAVGGELKSAVCLLSNREATLSEHLGDLTHPDAYRHFTAAIDRLTQLFDLQPRVVAHDAHPRYLSTQYAKRLGLPTVPVQHHHAHIAGVMAEWNETRPVVGLACDGAGFGADGAVWGCEVLRCTLGEFDRLGHLEYFPLPGGDAAAVHTWRPAAALLRQAFGDRWRGRLRECAEFHPQVIAPHDVDILERQLETGVNSPPSSSLGRVFDAVAFLTGLCATNRHEAEAAMALESAAAGRHAPPYPYAVALTDGAISLSLAPAIAAVVEDVRAAAPAARIAARFHASVAHLLAVAAETAAKLTGIETVALSGGCFANRLLLRRLVELLEQRRLRVLYHRRVPCGDGGLALGQAVSAAWRIRHENETGATRGAC